MLNMLNIKYIYIVYYIIILLYYHVEYILELNKQA